VGTSLTVSTFTGDGLGAAYPVFDAVDATDAASTLRDRRRHGRRVELMPRAGSWVLSGAVDASHSAANVPTPDLTRVVKAVSIAANPVGDIVSTASVISTTRHADACPTRHAWLRSALLVVTARNTASWAGARTKLVWSSCVKPASH
jgi:hypothetical protein